MMKVLWGFLFIVGLLISSSIAQECTSCDSCPVDGRADCGLGDQETCEEYKCLWCPLGNEEGPWCAVNTGLSVSEECKKEDSDKVDCGYFGISPSECENRTCCWQPSAVEGVPWCYHSPTSDKCTTCDACPSPARSDCGNAETTQDECEGNKCLWCPLEEPGPWCVIDTSLAVSEQCQAEDDKKQECGHLGITASECEERNCCWQPSSSDGVPWCYHSSEAFECTSCEACPATARRDCGTSQTTQKECEANKCLWCPLEDEEGPWCVVDTGLVANEECTVENEDKDECGTVGIDSQECEKRGCCWYPSTNDGTPWCYHKKGQ